MEKGNLSIFNVYNRIDLPKPIPIPIQVIEEEIEEQQKEVEIEEEYVYCNPEFTDNFKKAYEKLYTDFNEVNKHKLMTMIKNEYNFSKECKYSNLLSIFSRTIGSWYFRNTYDEDKIKINIEVRNQNIINALLFATSVVCNVLDNVDRFKFIQGVIDNIPLDYDFHSPRGMDYFNELINFIRYQNSTLGNDIIRNKHYLGYKIIQILYKYPKQEDYIVSLLKEFNITTFGNEYINNKQFTLLSDYVCNTIDPKETLSQKLKYLDIADNEYEEDHLLIDKEDIENANKKIDKFLSYNKVTTNILRNVFDEEFIKKLKKYETYFKYLISKLYKITDMIHLTHLLLEHKLDDIVIWMRDNKYITKTQINKGIEKYMRFQSIRLKEIGKFTSIHQL